MTVEETTDPKIAKLTKVFLKIKAKREEISKEDKALEEQQKMIKDALLDHCKETGVEGARTAEGTFSRTVRTSYWSSDWQEMHAFTMARNLPEFYEKRLNQGVVKQYLEENPNDVPESLHVDSKYSITISKPRKK